MSTHKTINQYRILGISLSSHGFGYAVTEGDNRLVNYGHAVIKKRKNVGTLDRIGKVIAHNKPDIVVLRSVNATGARRATRIKQLHMKIVAWVKKRKLKVVEISGPQLRNTLLGRQNGTKQEMAEALAKQFPVELAFRLPAKRRFYESEDSRMDIFDAVGLVVVEIMLLISIEQENSLD